MTSDDDACTPPGPDERQVVGELRAKADLLWSRRDAGRPLSRAFGEVVLGELPAGPAEFLVVSREVRAGRAPIFKTRIWVIDPRGDRRPTKWGLCLPAAMLPRFARLVAAAVEAELSDTARARAAREGSPAGREADDLPARASGVAGQTQR